MQLETNAQLVPLIARYAALQARLGAEFGARPLVLPNGSFFPDRFERSPDGVRRLLRRMQAHAGMSDIPIDVALEDSAEETSSSCGSGACAPRAPANDARLVLTEESWTLRVSTAELAHPVALTTLLASALSMVFLDETRPDGASLPAPLAVTGELTGVGLGLGVLLLEGSYVYGKSCGGPSVAKLTQLGAGQLAPLVALFALQHGHPLEPALACVSTTQRALLADAKAWAKANRRVADALARDPASLANANFELAEPSPSLFGFFGRGRSAPQPAPGTELDAEFEAALAAAPSLPVVKKAPRAADPARDELRALVDGALSEMRRG